MSMSSKFGEQRGKEGGMDRVTESKERSKQRGELIIKFRQRAYLMKFCQNSPKLLCMHSGIHIHVSAGI